jgi:nitrate reductase NapE component
MRTDEIVKVVKVAVVVWIVVSLAFGHGHGFMFDLIVMESIVIE